MTMYVRTVVPITVSVGDQYRDDDFFLDSKSAYKVLPLWVAQRVSFQRLWASGKIQVATDSAFSNIITSIPVRATVPTSAVSTGVAGEISYDDSFFYVCTATNTWRRTALSTW